MDIMIFESKRALIFDIDGTLWDATEQLCEVWNNVIRSLGIERRLTAGEVRSIMGMDSKTGKTDKWLGEIGF